MEPEARLNEIARQIAGISRGIAFLREELAPARNRRKDHCPSETSDRLAGYLSLTPLLSEDAILHNLLQCAMRVVHGSGAGLTLMDPKKQRLVFRAALGDGADGIIGEEVPLKGSRHEGSRHGLAFATGEV